MDDFTPDPRTVARLDQDQARLIALVAAAAEHADAHACPHAGACPGEDVVDAVSALPVDERDRVLHLALAVLASAGYTRPPRYRLTPAGYAALNHQPPDRWPFGGHRA